MARFAPTIFAAADRILPAAIVKSFPLFAQAQQETLASMDAVG
jgi:hypothetical protein